MIDTEQFQGRITELQQALKNQMRLRGSTLEALLRRAGRRLPRRQRRAGAIILGAQDWMAHPKLARVLNRTQVDNAFADLFAYLQGLDPKEARKTAILRLLGSILFNLIALGLLLYTLMTLMNAV